LATLIQNAVTAAVQPLQTEINNLKALNAAGITPSNLGGAQPAAAVQPAGAVNGGAPAPAPIDFKNASAVQLINLGRKRAAADNKLLPAEEVPVVADQA
jgi:hypothetical protein